MGIIDMTKMAAKVMQTRKKMSKIEAVGQSGPVAVVINGLYSVVDIEIDAEQLKEKFQNQESTKAIEEVVKLLKRDLKDAMEDAKKQLEKEMAGATSMDDLKDMLS